jgi:large subunit ribosomal protein L16
MSIINYKKRFKNKKIIYVYKKSIGSIQFGYYGIKSLGYGILNATQIESIRRLVIRISKRNLKLIIRLYFYNPLTFKPLLSRMGKGVGNIKVWVAYIKIGSIFLEFSGINNNMATKIFNKIYYRLPFKTKFIRRDNVYYSHI